MDPIMMRRAAAAMGGGGDSLLRGLAAYWKLDEASGARADVLGQSNLTAGTVPATTVSGKLHPLALELIGTSENRFLYRASNTKLQANPGGFTFAWWINFNDVSADIYKVVSKWGTEYQLYYVVGADLGLLWTAYSGGVQKGLAGGGLTTNAWHLAIFGQANGKLFMQIDNGSVIETACGPVDTGDTNFQLGTYSRMRQRYSDGALWHRELTLDERARLWNGGMGLAYPFGASHVIAFHGDSLTYGNGASTAYPNQTITSLGGLYNWYNLGHAGAGFETILSEAAANVDSKLVPGIKNICVICAGINNLYPSGTTATGASVYAQYQTYVAARKAAGWHKVLVTTLTPIDGARIANLDADYETERQTLNILLRADYAGGDGIVDPGGDATLSDPTSTKYYSDGLHMTAAGYAVWAALAKTALLSV